jgi:hypothetical protein
MPKVRITDRQHPLYGMICYVKEQRSDGLYPVVVVDESWHSGYAREEQFEWLLAVIPIAYGVDEDGAEEQ